MDDYMIPRDLDLDWLENAVELVVSGKHRYRQQGKTTAYLMLMLGEVELGGPSNTYLYIGENTTHTERVCSAFYKLVVRTLDASVVTKHTYTRVDVGDQQFHFQSVRRLMSDPHLVRNFQGLDRIFFDVDDSVQKRLDTNGELSVLVDQLLPVLSYKRGDVI